MCRRRGPGPGRRWRNSWNKRIPCRRCWWMDERGAANRAAEALRGRRSPGGLEVSTYTPEGPSVSLEGPPPSLEGPFVSLDGPPVSLEGPPVSLEGPPARQNVSLTDPKPPCKSRCRR